MFIVLVGPKGSGKSHVGRLLQARLGVHFVHVESVWLAYHAECRAAGMQPVITEGVARVRPVLARALVEHAHVSAETTGASPEILDGLLTQAPRARTIVARVTAPLALCLQRISTRNPTHQIPLSTDQVRRVHALSEAAAIVPDLTLDNRGLTDDEIIDLFRPHLSTPPHRP
jgi:cytidylate kinase